MLYRVDKRDFIIGDAIPLNNISYIRSLSEEKLEIERFLEDHRPFNCPKRSERLFVFLELYDAFLFCIRSSNATIYAVTPTSTENIFRGDMCIVESLSSYWDYLSTDCKNLLADNYWKGLKTYKSCWEYLVQVVTVDSIVAKNSNYCFMSEYKDNGCIIEKMPMYQIALKKSL